MRCTRSVVVRQKNNNPLPVICPADTSKQYIVLDELCLKCGGRVVNVSLLNYIITPTIIRCNYLISEINHMLELVPFRIRTSQLCVLIKNGAKYIFLILNYKSIFYIFY